MTERRLTADDIAMIAGWINPYRTHLADLIHDLELLEAEVERLRYFVKCVSADCGGAVRLKMSKTGLAPSLLLHFTFKRGILRPLYFHSPIVMKYWLWVYQGRTDEQPDWFALAGV